MPARMRIIAVLALASWFSATWAAEGGGAPCLEFTDTVCDLGRIAAGSGYHECRFEFVNRADSAVSIVGALSACGCTVPTYPKHPVAPGQRGVVTVTYDASGRPAGEIDKTITLITTGRPERIVLRIAGEAFTLQNTLR